MLLALLDCNPVFLVSHMFTSLLFHKIQNKGANTMCKSLTGLRDYLPTYKNCNNQTSRIEGNTGSLNQIFALTKKKNSRKYITKSSCSLLHDHNSIYLQSVVVFLRNFNLLCGHLHQID